MAEVEAAAPAPPPVPSEAELTAMFEENRKLLPLMAFKKICAMVSVGELLRLRATCKFWNQVIIELPKYLENTEVVLDKNWAKRRGPHYNLLSVARWRNLHFSHYVFARNYFSRIIWPQAKLTLTTLVFKEVTIRCERVTKLLNETVNLDSVSLIKINFPNPMAHYGEPAPERQIFCNHTDVERAINPYAYGNRSSVTPGRISKVICRGNPVIPNCVLLLLIARSRGTIREFEFSKSVRRVPDTMVPPANEVERTIATRLLAFRANRDVPSVLQKLVLTDITSDLEILPSISGADEEVALQELCLAQHDGTSQVQTDRIMAFLRWQERRNSLRKLDLTVHNTWNVDQLFLILAGVGMHGVEKLRLHFGPRDAENRNVNLNGLQYLHSVTDLEVSTAPKVEADTISRVYLGLLRPTIRRLYLDHPGILEQDLIGFLDSRAVTNLKEFHVIQGQGVTNAVMDHIIRMLPELEQLSINDAQNLTDSGLLGWPQATIDFLHRTNSYASIINGKDNPGGNPGRSIKELTRLRSLNLRRCPKVSDISVIRGFILPHLRDIDITSTTVTDLGLLWLAKNNPGLEKVICKKSNKITRFGLNQLITSFPTIRKIYTSKQLLDKSIGNIRFANCDRYQSVVTTK